MTLYKRTSQLKLFVMRMVILVVTIFCIYLFEHHHMDVGYLLAIATILCGMITVNQLYIFSNSVTIIQYHFFGLIPRKIIFSKENNTVVKPFEFEVADDTMYPTNSLFDVLQMMRPASKIPMQYYSLHEGQGHGNFKMLKLKLDPLEYKMIAECFGSERLLRIR